MAEGLRLQHQALRQCHQEWFGKLARYIGSLEAVQLVANVEREQKTWFTEKTNYPKTALPSISGVPESNLGVHLSLKSVHVDLDKVGNYVGSFFRFGFESTDSHFKKWWHSDERASMNSNQLWSRMERVANKVGDDVRSSWISPNDVALENFSLEIFAGG
ncbi:MAG: hypothetical protein ACK49B_05545 [Burkholderiales bacterium]